jgi:2',3'-cyclic-nucleotide 2'-phosphodiesterase (5'-nucleotidase family)
MRSLTLKSTLNPALLASLAAAFAAPAFAQISVNSVATLDAVRNDPQPVNVAFWLTVLHNNDGESQLINAGQGTLADFGGVARFKTLADNLKAQSLVYPADSVEKGWVMISSGDNFLAGPEFNASLVRGIPYYDSVAMDLIGYTAAAIGNHEFDFGPDILRNFLAGFTGPVPFLSANLSFVNEPGLQILVNQGRIARSTIATIPTTQGTKRVGIIGATTTDLPFISTPRNTIVNAVLPAVQAEVAALRNANVDIIILTSHLQGLTSEFALAPQLSDVDIIIGGGGGELLANPNAVLVPGDTRNTTNLGGTGYPRTAVDANGRNVPVVTTSGDYKYLGRLIVGFDSLGNVVAIDTLSNPVRVSGIAPDAVASDPVVQAQVVNPVAAAVASLANNVIATSQIPLDGVTNNVRSRETNLGNLAADAMLFNATVQAVQFGTPIPTVALQNSGGMRNNSIIPAGNFTELNTFEILPFANFLCVVPNIPPVQFKQILENCVANVAGTPGGGSGTGRFAQVSGFRFTWDATAQRQIVDNAGNVTQAGFRVRDVVLNDGRVIVRNGLIAPGAPRVNIATIDFLARGGDQYPFRGAPFTVLGVSYQQSLRNYIQQWLGGNITTQQYPVGGQNRIRRIN